jgi:protein gp37
MGDQRGRGISWTDRTWNVIRGCRRVNQDCVNCYAERTAAVRLSNPGQAYYGLAVRTPNGPRWTGQVQLVEDQLSQPLTWKKPSLVFVNAMSDLFIDQLSDIDIDKIVTVMAVAERHTFQVLTKRPARMADYLARASSEYAWRTWPLPNVWWGVSMGHQKAADEFLVDTIRCRDHAAALWVSAEPLTEAVDLFHYFPREVETGQLSSAWVKGIDWVVGGGESGPDARPCPLAAARKLRDDCVRFGVPFHWKQWGEWCPVTHYEIGGKYLGPDGLVYSPRVVMGIESGTVARLGKKAAGRHLDGLIWDQYPRHSKRNAS